MPDTGLSPTSTDTSNPFAAWMANPGTAASGGMPAASPFGNTQIGAAAPTGGSYGNPGGLGNWTSPNSVAKNIGITNLQTGQERNQLIPAFSNNMFSAAGPAIDFYKQLMDPNSPFARFFQRASWEQGVKQSSDAGAQARQNIRASGYGYTPSGVEAASLGDQSRGMSSTLISNFLSNLFSMPEAGAQGLQQLAALFNPAQLTGQATPTGQMQQTPTFMQNFTNLLNSLSGATTAGSGAAKTLGG
jgi:hypothetical protein